MSRLFFMCWVMLIIARSGVAGFTCPGVGDFPDPRDCKVIHKCSSRGAESKDFLCPPGTVFDQKCVWPHATRRRCDSGESGVSSKVGDQDEGEIASPHRSLFRADPKTPTVAARSNKDSTNEVSFNDTYEATTEINGSIMESGLGTRENIESKTKAVTETKTKSLFAGSRGFDLNNTGNSDVAGTSDPTSQLPPENAAQTLFTGRTPSRAGGSVPTSHLGSKVMDQTVEDAAKNLPQLEALGNLDDNADLQDYKGFEDRIQSDIEPSNDNTGISPTENAFGDFSLDKLCAAVSLVFERLQRKAHSSRLEGSRMLGDISANVDSRLSRAKAGITRMLKQWRAEVTEVLGQGKRLSLGVLEAGLGLSSELVKTGRRLTNKLLGMGRMASDKVNYFGQALTEKVAVSVSQLLTLTPMPVFLRRLNNILRHVSTRLRTLVDHIDSYSYAMSQVGLK